MLRSLTISTIVWILTPPAFLFGQRPAYTPEQLSLVRTISESRISPDGTTVAFVSDITGAMELWTVPAQGGWPHQLTNLNEHVADIRWSPDSRWLVFTSDYGGNERRDLFRVAAAGGAVEKLTDTKLSESEPRFSPDGKRLAFTADPDREFHFQLHVMDLESRKIVRLTHEKDKLQYPVWSPDGKTIAINRSGDDQKGELLLVHADTGAVVVVEPAIKDGILVPEDFSPDGKSLLLLARNPVGFIQVALLELEATKDSGKPPRPTKPPFFLANSSKTKADVTEACWVKLADDEEKIFYLENLNGKTLLNALYPPNAILPINLFSPPGVIRQLSLDRSGRSVTFLREEVTRPADVWCAQSPFRFNEMDFKPITFSLMGGVKPSELSAGEMTSYPSFDKTKIHTLLIKPRVPRLGSPPPAIVYVHGGPNGQVIASFDPYLHVLAEAGFAVIAPNYRGSTGYGKPFEDANNKDWGGGDLKDLTAAVKHFGDQSVIDPKRVGITGGSYGGYMTLMALCKTPTVWKAGVESYGMPDLVMDYLLSKSRFAEWYETEMGNPKTDAALFRERSPLPYLDDIKAPLLIFQGAGDTNVPKAESDLLVAVLKELKKPHEYIVYEDEGHGFTKRKNLLDQYKRTVDFFVKELKPK